MVTEYLLSQYLMELEEAELRLLEALDPLLFLSPLDPLATAASLLIIYLFRVEEDGMEEDLDILEGVEEDRVIVALAQEDMPQGLFRVEPQVHLAQELS